MSKKKFFWEKDPTEIKTFEVDWVNYKTATETMLSHVIQAFLSGVDKTNDIIGGNQISGTSSVLTIKGGEAGKTYNIGITATSSVSAVYVQRADLEVKE